MKLVDTTNEEYKKQINGVVRIATERTSNVQ